MCFLMKQGKHILPQIKNGSNVTPMRGKLLQFKKRYKKKFGR